MRHLLAIIFLLLASHATAQENCLPMTTVTPYMTGTIQNVGYNSDTRNLMVQYRAAPNTFRAFQAVPPQIAQRFTGLQSADSFFNSAIANSYHEAIFSQAPNPYCPIQNENGNWLWSH